MKTNFIPRAEGNSITHKQFEKQIPLFLEDRLANRALEAFLRHLDSCGSCQDELSIQFLVFAGMPKLETGETFNLQKELDADIQTERGRLRRREHLGAAAFILEVITLAAMVMAAVTGIMLFM